MQTTFAVLISREQLSLHKTFIRIRKHTYWQQRRVSLFQTITSTNINPYYYY